MGISIGLNGIGAVEGQISSLIGWVRKAMLKEIGDELVTSTIERFEEEVDPEGNEWELKKSTLEWKEKTGYTKKLQVSGDLKKSITRQVRGKELKMGTDREYGLYLQTGTKHMEPKPFIGLSEEDKDMIEDILKEYIGRYL